MIKIQNLDLSYKKNQVLQDLDLTLKSGQINGIVGLNGSGKTTLLKTITGEFGNGLENAHGGSLVDPAVFGAGDEHVALRIHLFLDLFTWIENTLIDNIHFYIHQLQFPIYFWF